MNIGETQANNPPFRYAAIAIAGSTLLGLLAVSMHPGVSNAHSLQETMNQIVAFTMHDEFIHGFLIVLLAVIASGFSVFSDLLGNHRSSVRFGKTAYMLGYAAMTAAMLFDGFVVPMLAKQYVSANANDMQTAFVVVQSIGIFIQVLTKAGILAMSVAFLGWAYALHSTAKSSKWAAKFAWIGYAVGIVSISIVLFVSIWLGPHNLVAIFAVHAIWNFCVAAMLLHGTKTLE
jgi:hypothetical protein